MSKTRRRRLERRSLAEMRLAAVGLLALFASGLAAAQAGGTDEGAEAPPAHAGAGEAPASQAAAADAAAEIEAQGEEGPNGSASNGTAGAASGARSAADQPEGQASDRAADPAADPTSASDQAADQASDQASNEPAEQPITSRLEALIELGRLMDDKKFDKAVPVGEQVVRLTEKEFGQTLETAEAYIALAQAEREARRHEQSEQDYLHGIDLIRRLDGNFSERAIDPLVGLGDNYKQAGQYLNAVTTYNEARTISRRVYGLLSERQIPILDKLADSFWNLDQYADADKQELDILRLSERNYPAGSPEYLDGIYRYAGWLRKTARYNEEREQYDRAIRLIRDEHGKESPLLVRPLRETANSFRMQRIPDERGVGALKTALEILDMQTSPDALSRAEVLRDLGDWEVAFAESGRADTDAYIQAWRALGATQNADALRKDWFGDLENVLGEPISQRGLSDDPKAQQGYVIVQFDVDQFGQTHNVEIVKSDPPGFKDDAVARAVRRWRFRPFMVDGAIVPKDQVALRFNYRYKPGDEDKDA
ncbi:MAG TPA: TonB family protein [Gammaproteobacteria bacterium]|nr:TonB family protein [Gammaproteobacteria bacterium]